MRRLVADLLEPNGAERSVAHRVRRLADLSDVLSLLAEAAPTEVVDALEEDHQGTKTNASAALFADAEARAASVGRAVTPRGCASGAVRRVLVSRRAGRLDR
ncbi:MAG: hypothetical protein OXC29_28280, partial [Rhodococcus sp.]|nr:hypothetical protein [Rhodococcus sp. (in: high G+C Gram-positive bacteria)]